MTLVCMSLVDKLGRRMLLLTGMIGMCISSFGMAIFQILNKVQLENKNHLNKIRINKIR